MTPEPLRVALVDDEPLARSALRSALSGFDDAVVVVEAEDGPDAVDQLRNAEVDVVFLDVRMPGLDGFEVLDALEPDERPAVVFVTAFDDHALRAFDVHAVDYLVKPFDDARFADMMAQVRQRVAQRRRGRLGGGSRRSSGTGTEHPSPPTPGSRSGTGPTSDSWTWPTCGTWKPTATTSCCISRRGTPPGSGTR